MVGCRVPGLSAEFVRALEQLIDLLSDLPEAFPEIAVGLCRALLGRFPYAGYHLTSDNWTFRPST